MNNPLISVIVPVYNVEQYLSKCVDSILGQTYTNLEVILVDDGSPDNCGHICDEYAEKDRRIKVIHKKNGGLSDARNAAIDVAKGEYITFVDSDDTITPDYIETLYQLVNKYQCKIGVACLQTYLEGANPSISQPKYREKELFILDGIQEMFYQELFDTTAPCKIFHRSLFETSIRFPVGLLYEDLATTFRLMYKADKVAFCNRIIYNYLLRPNSIEGQPFNVKKLDSALRILEMFENYTIELRPIKKAVRCRLLSFCLHILLEMPAGYSDKRKQVLIDYVKRNRWKVMTDGRARKKARIGALVSYLGLNTTRRILNRIKERNK